MRALEKGEQWIFEKLPELRRDTPCLLYTSDAADDLLCVDLGGRRIIKKQQNTIHTPIPLLNN